MERTGDDEGRQEALHLPALPSSQQALTLPSLGVDFFPTDYEPTVFENYVETLTVDGQVVDLSLWDTAGQEEFDRLRSLSYADTHVVMVCFSVERPESLENVEAKWIPEVNYYCAGVKVILVALKCDLRDDVDAALRLRARGMRMIGYDEGLAVAERIKASRYLGTSRSSSLPVPSSDAWSGKKELVLILGVQNVPLKWAAG
ncbi:hypothetical protein QFC20_007275 [Naganishia adeliensis]|uniref:Uncharacterized protein n=1 Tax=Naganishia adeliensis TaxID=92952 RepID=A0ACC2V252_9TREE|nr:hypothetical protein QFC20_007275 [Naganishia adeliensis]